MNEYSKNLPTIVEFHGQQLLSQKSDDGTVMVAMLPIIEGMGMDWKSQHRKIVRQGSKFNHGHMTMVASDGKQRSMLCIPLTKLNGWLFSINPNKIPNPEIRAKVIQYQEECFVVLHDYWHRGAALNPRVELQHQPWQVPSPWALQEGLRSLSRRLQHLEACMSNGQLLNPKKGGPIKARTSACRDIDSERDFIGEKIDQFLQERVVGAGRLDQRIRATELFKEFREWSGWNDLRQMTFGLRLRSTKVVAFSKWKWDAGRYFYIFTSLQAAHKTRGRAIVASRCRKG